MISWIDGFPNSGLFGITATKIPFLISLLMSFCTSLCSFSQRLTITPIILTSFSKNELTSAITLFTNSGTVSKLSFTTNKTGIPKFFAIEPLKSISKTEPSSVKSLPSTNTKSNSFSKFLYFSMMVS